MSGLNVVTVSLESKEWNTWIIVCDCDHYDKVKRDTAKEAKLFAEERAIEHNTREHNGSYVVDIVS